ncbi:MAG: IS200/IS605 family transposase [Sphingobacteriaceae bacterium]|nr:IS200/IS605 family transposase [Sphingobacteriaceae bacterium]MBK7312164.1 IS200/IS605 family transposase [Sphingobacteriaceae bacterium]MBK7816875.1 IS200/IS605 family transposase [Sphingobacteriaceae bacterium]
MPNTYQQIFIQIVFAVKGREGLISERNRDELQKFMTGIIHQRGQKTLAIYCMPDHVHVLVSINPSISISDLVRDVKAGSSKFINEKNWIRGIFRWQTGYGAFSYGREDTRYVINYILHQKEHHSKTTFRSEYLDLLKKNEVTYEERYLFEFVE